MRHKLLSASCMVAIAAMGVAPAYADPNPHGASCQDAAVSPGNSATSPGSVHNEPGISSVNGGKGGTAYNTGQNNSKGGGVSQYDISCTKVATNTNSSGNSVGTPVSVALPDPMTGLSTAVTANNSKATRTFNGTTSHTGAGK
jgi:hypothetical protein